MTKTEIIISFPNVDGRDVVIQSDLRFAMDLLNNCEIQIMPLPCVPPSEWDTAKGEVDILIESIRAIIPAGSVVAILAAFIKHFYQAKRNREIEFTNTDGTSIRITGYSKEETERLLLALPLTKKQKK